MSRLEGYGVRVVPVAGGRESADWRAVHNTIVPTAVLSADEVRERAGRNRLEVAYLDGVAVGCSTVRPPDGETPAATVIARILPEYRRRGFGTALYERGLAHARTLGGAGVETVVLASNEEGLRFALARGFTEVERYVLPGDTIPFVTLRLGWSAVRGQLSD
ncbi:GNAT family N-acetyltransferase [Streptomyces omiyaensis]|uniref:GNAT family N-acetyltransferase n=1 Tax=Streptomyces omiyaensis TaxID=68247 RepID=UPI0016794750|nr:GNAT family N-acetyltransferase [Streptomyces omiyaensis]